MIINDTRPGSHLVAIEPNPHMHPALTRAAAARGVSLDVRSTGAEASYRLRSVFLPVNEQVAGTAAVGESS